MAHARLIDGIVSSPYTPSSGSPPLREIRVWLGIERLGDVPVDLPGDAPAADVATKLARVIGGTADADAEGRILLLPPIPRHAPRDFLRLALAPSTRLTLDGATTALLGNVALASHGETVRAEIVGDGDAAHPFQRFALKKKPVTHLAASTATGVRSTIRLFVNGVRWRETGTLYGASARDEIFVPRISDDATLTVQFGDGASGARVPTGRSNVVASYRQGLGVAGRVRASSLTTLLDRPAGLKSVVNPLTADGGADPETLAGARERAPGTVRTFGRAVALRDFADIAMASGEVAKAAAFWVWTGERRVVHVTVAAQGGGRFSGDGLQRIRERLAAQRDPNHTVLIDNFVRIPIVVRASLLVDERHITTEVLTAARTALLDVLSFERLAFAQPVHLSDVYAVLQNVPGVVAVDIDDLDVASIDPTFRAAHGATAARPQPSVRPLPARPGLNHTVLPAEQAWIEDPARDVTLTASGGLAV
jgi:predicted phage baseplate assembly protein